jgi:hypothetical protein
MSAADKHPGSGLVVGGGLLLVAALATYPLQSIQEATIMDALASRDPQVFAIVEKSVSVTNNWYRVPMLVIGVALIAVGSFRTARKFLADD